MSDVKSIGDILRDKREEISISVEDASRETGIKTENIEFLETCNFSEFPNKVYARSFLRDYANFLALDSSKLLDRFENEYASSVGLKGTGTFGISETSDSNISISEESNTSAKAGEALNYSTETEEIDEKELEKEALESNFKNTSKDDFSGFGKIIATFIVFLLLAGLAYGIYVKSSQKSKNPNTPAGSVVQSMPKTDKTGKKVSSSVSNIYEEKGTVSAGKNISSQKSDTQYAKGVTVKVGTFNDCWIRVVVDGNVEYLGTLPKGISKTFYGQNYVKMRAGNAGNIQIRVNGRLEDKMGIPGQPLSKSYYINTPETKPQP